MVSRDYTKEVGLHSGQKTIAKPYAALIIVGLAIAGWYVIHTSAMARTGRGPDAGHDSTVAATRQP